MEDIYFVCIVFLIAISLCFNATMFHIILCRLEDIQTPPVEPSPGLPVADEKPDVKEVD